MIGIFLKLASNKLIYQLLFFAFVCNIHGQDFSKPHILLTNKITKSEQYFPNLVQSKVRFENDLLAKGQILVTSNSQIKVNDRIIDPRTINSITLPTKNRPWLFIGVGLTLVGSISLLGRGGSNSNGLNAASDFVFLVPGLIITSLSLSPQKKYDLSKGWELKVKY